MGRLGLGYFATTLAGNPEDLETIERLAIEKQRLYGLTWERAEDTINVYTSLPGCLVEFLGDALVEIGQDRPTHQELDGCIVEVTERP